MSGYLEVKYPFKSNLGLNPFKCWKRQWCILRPSPTGSGGSLAVYCSEAGAAAGAAELPPGGAVRRAKSRSRRYAFAVFRADDPTKPQVLLAAPTLHDAESWMEKIKALLNGDQMLGTETLLKDSYSVNVIVTDLSIKCDVSFHAVFTLSSRGVQVSSSEQAVFIEWRHIADVLLANEDDSRVCVITVNSDFKGGGELKLQGQLASELGQALKQVRLEGRHRRAPLSRSDGDLRAKTDDLGDIRRSSWYSGPSDVSLDDIDLVMSKEWSQPSLSRCSAERDLALRGRSQTCPESMSSDRQSLVSVASGIYEEIPDVPEADQSLYCKMGGQQWSEPAAGLEEPLALRGGAGLEEPLALRDVGLEEPLALRGGAGLEDPLALRDVGLEEPRASGEGAGLEEPTYESVAECVHATMRRQGKRYPPPLPPRLVLGCKPSAGWGCASAESLSWSRAATLPKNRSTFSVFRKRLKSDSRLATSPKSESSKENKDIETKKKRFDFAPTRDIFKNFKVSRKMKNLKISSLTKGGTKSCEFLDDTDHLIPNRCSKSVECLENDIVDDYDADLSIEFNDDAVADLALPQEILDIILRSREQINKIRLKDNQVENDYMPMSPIVPPPPIEHHYSVMLPKTNLA